MIKIVFMRSILNLENDSKDTIENLDIKKDHQKPILESLSSIQDI